MQLKELLTCIRPGDVITNTAWPQGRTFTVSTEFMKFHTGRGTDVHERNSCPDGAWYGWSVANKYATVLNRRAVAQSHNPIKEDVS
ncbi:hypothetical protein MORTIMER_101 [Erwinia phage vB_EamM_Mortimer]|uniref:Uncharacterized protein n=1 Tax=Erwinia phage vB_EamM_Mortimer TaxID=2060129 RepID=A0A2H5BKJ6_9CAUD|nr:hypothetical protein MORTIMER_101 [Erwinia phage vB_EamM_Mortimer]